MENENKDVTEETKKENKEEIKEATKEETKEETTDAAASQDTSDGTDYTQGDKITIKIAHVSQEGVPIDVA